MDMHVLLAIWQLCLVILKAVLELWHLEETNKVGVGGHKVDERQRDIVQ